MPTTASPQPPHGRQLLRSRVVLPVSQPPIQDGAVLIAGNRIAAVGSWKTLSSATADEMLDLGEMILLPGLINAHCHLDYTGMAGLLPPQRSFTNWIKLMLAAKAEWSYADYAQSWLEGARMLLRSGTTMVADFEAVPELLPEVWTATPLRVLSLLELTGVKSRRAPADIVAEALERIAALPCGHSHAGLAPHAPYSTFSELIRLSARAARRNRWPLAIHVSESAQEFEMFTRARGELADWLRGNQRELNDCGLGSPIRHLERSDALGANLLAIHVNYLAPGDAALLARHKVNVVHCPRSHYYFQHEPFPFEQLAAARVNICLGTDSLATVFKRARETVELSLFEDMRDFAAAHPGVRPETILQMATVNGARALGLAGQAGELSENALADLIAIPFSGKITRSAEAVLDHSGPVAASLIAGHWAVSPPNLALAN